MSLIARTSRAFPSHSRAFIVASSSASTSVPTLNTALQHRRTLATPTGPAKPYHHEKPPPPPPTWLTVQLRKNPLAMKLFLNMMSVFGYGSVKQIAARRALNIYDQHCSGKAEEEKEFWRDECHLPPTFQSWFTITNLHIWILTTRLRALPAPEAQHLVQGLIDHFFLDVEDRIREVLQPATPRAVPSPSSSSSSDSTSSSQETQPGSKQDSFYAEKSNSSTAPKKKGKAPEALVTKQMKIFREQWAGLGLAFDLALVKGDEELAAAVWRNLLGARGAQGIAYPSSSPPSSAVVDGKHTHFKRAINPTAEIEGYSKLSPAKLRELESKDDGSGVHDFAPHQADLYLKYPETMARVVEYVRREVRRLGQMSDEEVRGEMTIGREWVGVEGLAFGRIPKAVKVKA